MSLNLVYKNYWRRKQLREGVVPAFPVRRWWPSEGLSDIEQVLFDAIRNAPSVLDVGAGDLRTLRKFRAAGYAGEYHTQDIGDEFSYDYQDLSEVQRGYGAVLCLDVIEHLPLADGLALVVRMVELLEPGGTLVLQTPNALFVRDPMAWDMTHVQLYNLLDLWSYLTCLDLEVTGYRVVLAPPPRNLLQRLRFAATAYVISRVLSCDYTDNIVVIARKPGGTRIADVS